MFKLFSKLKVKMNESYSAWKEKPGKKIGNIQKMKSTN